MAEEIANEEFREKSLTATIFNFFSMGLILLSTTVYFMFSLLFKTETCDITGISASGLVDQVAQEATTL